MSPAGKRKGSASYWKDKFEQSQALIRDMAEKSLQLDDVPGLLTIKKVTPNPDKASTGTTRVTQVHGSMRAKDVASKVKEIKEEKLRIQAAKEAKKTQKEERKETFIRCKTKCSCNQKKCLALGLKQCSVCLNVLRSVCSKAACRVDGEKPAMILPAKQQSFPSKRLFEADSDEEDDEDDIEELSSSEEDCFSGDERPDEPIDEGISTSRTDMLKNTWKQLSPPTVESTIIGRWYAGVYETKNQENCVSAGYCDVF